MNMYKIMLPLLFVSTLLFACGKEDKNNVQQIPPPAVVLQEIRLQDVPVVYSFSGQLSGVDSVNVVARVEGNLLRQYYKNGAKVKKGESLFLIDPSTYQAQVKAKEAQYVGATSQYTYEKAEYERIHSLYQKKAYSTAQYEQALSTFQASKAQMDSAKQALDIAKINLAYTKVESSVNGIVQKPALTNGSLVQPGTLLTTIAGMDTLYVNFALPAKRQQQIMAFLASKMFILDPAGYTVTIVRSNGATYAAPAKVDFQGTSISTETNTVDWRAIVDNKEEELLPGEFVTAKLVGLTAKGVILVPQKAIIAQGSMSFVWVVDENNIVQMRPIVVEENIGTSMLVTKGLNEGERIIVDGILKARPNSPVTPVPASTFATKPATNASSSK